MEKTNAYKAYMKQSCVFGNVLGFDKSFSTPIIKLSKLKVNCFKVEDSCGILRMSNDLFSALALGFAPD